MNAWIYERCTSLYRDWKYVLHKHFLQHDVKGRNGTPLELARREEEWAWLRLHFQSPEFLKASIANKRNKGQQTHPHHAGSRSFQETFLESKGKGDQLPFVVSFAAGHHDQPEEVEKVRAAGMAALVEKAKAAYPDVPEEELPLNEFSIHGMEDAARILSQAVPSRNSFYVRGMGSAGDGLLTQLKGPTPRISPTAAALEAARVLLAVQEERTRKLQEEAEERSRKVQEDAIADRRMLVEQMEAQDRRHRDETASLRQQMLDMHQSLLSAMMSRGMERSPGAGRSRTSAGDGENQDETGGTP